jgi:enamine deaminase RidA (YjgF/YER057c/UK114 family)
VKKVIKTGLPGADAPIEWAVSADGIVYTAVIPIRADGSVDTGGIEGQTRLTLDNLKKVMAAAGGTLADVSQVLIYITDASDFETMNKVYRAYFSPPYPNRATVVVAALLVPGMRVEMVVHAHVGHRS